MSFSATEAAFEGFRLVRRKPLALLTWTLIYMVVSLASVLAMGAMAPAAADLTTLLEGYEATPPATLEEIAPVLNAYGRMLGGMSWVIVLSALSSVILTAAVARGVLEPQTGAKFGYVRLGMDELRVAVVSLVLFILMFLISCAAFLIAGVVGGMAAGMFEGWGWIVAVVLFLAAIALVIWLAVRWSLAIPITVAEKRLAFFDSFRVTRGKFWPMLGMAILAGVMALLVMLLSMLVTAPLNIASGLSMASSIDADPAAVFKAYNLRNPWVVATVVANAIIYALILAVLYAPFSAAYRDLTGRGDAA